jgi:LSU ribosomal protein L7AE
MGKAYYVKFETPEDLVSPILEAVRVASTSGKVKKEPMKQQRLLNVVLVN